MRPSKQKTPLAKLRAEPVKEILVPERGKKRAGQFKKVRIRLSRQDVANWLGCGVDNISSIESGRVKLTHQNAEIILAHTHVNLGWLLGKNNSPIPINVRYGKYTYKDYEEAQANLANPSLPAMKAQYELASNFGIVATILLNAVKRDKLTPYASKLRHALWEIMSEFQKEGEFVDLTGFIDMRHGSEAHKSHNFRTLLKEFSGQLMKIVRTKSKQAKSNQI